MEYILCTFDFVRQIKIFTTNQDQNYFGDGFWGCPEQDALCQIQMRDPVCSKVIKFESLCSIKTEDFYLKPKGNFCMAQA